MLHIVVATRMFIKDIPARVASRLHHEDGALAIEYAILAVVIALGLIAAAVLARDEIISMLGQIAAEDLPTCPTVPC